MQQIVAPKGSPNLKTADPTGATNLTNIKPIAHAERPIGASAGQILVDIDGEPKGASYSDNSDPGEPKRARSLIAHEQATGTMDGEPRGPATQMRVSLKSPRGP